MNQQLAKKLRNAYLLFEDFFLGSLFLLHVGILFFLLSFFNDGLRSESLRLQPFGIDKDEQDFVDDSLVVIIDNEILPADYTVSKRVR